MNVPPADATDETDETVDTEEYPTQKVTIRVEENAWRDLKVICARQKIKITEKAGQIIKEWLAANAAK